MKNSSFLINMLTALEQEAGLHPTDSSVSFWMSSEVFETVILNKIIKRITTKTGVMRLFIWQQPIKNISLGIYSNVRCVFCCLFPACFVLCGCILCPDFFFLNSLNVARQIIIYLGNVSRQRKCSCFFVPVERWIQNRCAILSTAGLSFKKAPPPMCWYLFFSCINT